MVAGLLQDGGGSEARVSAVGRSACVAQLVEHFLGKEEVTGSIPVASSGVPRVYIFLNEVGRARHHHARVYGLQAPELLDNEEQEEAFRPGGIQEVLPLVQQAHDAQGNPLDVCSARGDLPAPRRSHRRNPLRGVVAAFPGDNPDRLTVIERVRRRRQGCCGASSRAGCGGPYVSSSIGRAAVSKTAGWGFESLLTCARDRSTIVWGLWSMVNRLGRYPR